MIWNTFLAGLPTWLTVVAVLISLSETSTAVEFNDTCDESSSLCNTTQDLECAVVTNQTKICKCKENTYYNGGTCANNNIDNLQVKDPGASTVNQTQLLVTWTLPTHSSSIDRIEVSTTPVTQTVTVNNPLATQATLTGLTAGTPYTITITSIETTSRVAEQSTSVTTSGTTGALKGFNEPCTSTVKCDESKNLGCSLQFLCKCVQNHYYDGSVCSSTLDNLKVGSPTAVANSQAQVTVSWTTPTASSAVNSIEVSWTPSNHGETQPKVLASTSTTTTISGLQGGTDYIITITSKDSSSGSTTISQSVTANVKTNALKGFNEPCTSTVKCDESKNLECSLQFLCKCVQNHYYSGTVCSNTLDNLKVGSPYAVANSQTQVTVSWTTPTASSAVNGIEVSWTPSSHGETQPKVLASTSTTTTISGLQGGTDYIITITSKDSSSGSTTISQSVTANVKTSALKGFNEPCSSTVKCDESKKLECNQQFVCKCVQIHYYSGTVCSNTLDNLKVGSPNAVANSQTQVTVSWTTPTASSAVNGIEVSWTPSSHGETQPKVLASTSTTTTISGLQGGTDYIITITSKDSSSGSTTISQSVTANVKTSAHKGFNEPCSSTVKCDESKKLECNQQFVCKCVQIHYYSGTVCSNTLDNLKVGSPNAVANSQTQVTVSWTTPTASSAVNGIEVSWTPSSHGETQPKVLASTSTTTTISGLQGGTDYIITITSKDSSSGSTTISQSVTANVKTSALKGFNEPCSSTVKCDESKKLECNQQFVCKCVQIHYYSGTVCSNTLDNLKVGSPNAVANSQTQVTVSWTTPTASSAVNGIEVSWTPSSHGETQPKVLASTSTTTTISGLQGGTDYIITITSKDSSSGSTTISQSVTANVKTSALKGFNEPCSSTVKCDESKKLECNQQFVCKCVQIHYYSGTVCSNTLDNLKVRSPNAVANSQIQVTVSWTIPIASSAVNTIEVSWTPIHGETQPKVLASTSTTTTIFGLQGGTDYVITITSNDTSSGSTTISQSVTVNVKTKSALGGSCSSLNNCDGSYVECVASQCQCQTSYYDDNNALAAGTCKPLSELKTTNVQVTVHNTTSVNLTWTNPTANSAIESKQVRWSGTTAGSGTTTTSKMVSLSDTSTTVTGLIPGGSYSITVVSIDTNSRNIQQEASSDPVQVTTKPAVPGRIGSIVPDNTGYHVTLSWISSVGVVTHYRVVFDGGNGDTRTQTTSTNFITMISLTPGRRYNITITAVSGSMTSDPIYGNTRTTVIAPSAPMNLQCVTIMDTNVILSWTPPANPNGDIMYYSVNVISGPGSPRTLNTTTPTPTKEIDKLTEESYYSFTVRAMNDKYSGPQSMSATCTTKPGLPSKPQNLLITAVLSRDFNVIWKKPNSTKGSLIGYRIAVNNGTTCSKEILYRCSDCVQKPSFTSNCHVDSKITIQITAVGLNNDSFIQRVEGLFPYISYSVSVNAIINPGDGYKETVVVKTKEEAPQDLTRVSVDILNPTSMKVSWNIPNPRPGVTKYSIDVIDVIDGEQTLNKSVEVQGFYERSTILTNLEEYWQYVINIKALTSIGQSAVKTITPNKTLPAAPGKVADFKVSRSDGDYKTATITWSIPSLRDRNSLITSYEFTHNGTGTLSSKTLAHRANIEELFTESIIVQPGNYYYVEVFAINNNNQSGVKSSELYYAPSDQSTSDSLLTGVVAGSTVTVAVIILLVIVIVLITRKRKHNSKNRKDENYDDLQMSPYVNQGRVVGEDKTYTSLFKENKINRYRPVILSNIYQIVMEMHTDSDLKFAKEFQDLETLSPKEQCKTAKLQNNRRKNRDQKILPFDSSRVKFIEDKTNYINASHLQNLKNNSSHDFIVTQHPLSNTIDDFWTMIWEQNVSVIVMLTPKKEDGQVSYDTYFSSEPQSSKQYGSINVETMMKCFIQKTELSSIRLKKGKKSRIIKHFHSFGWNDRYDRSTQKEVVQLIEAVKSNVTQSDKLGPIVVHCGLGTGRSGVYIALYQLMDCIHDNNVDIFDLVLTMRESRMQLVECESQYIFIYDCFLYMISKKKTNHSTSQDQATGDTYEYIHIKCKI